MRVCVEGVTPIPPPPSLPSPHTHSHTQKGVDDTLLLPFRDKEVAARLERVSGCVPGVLVGRFRRALLAYSRALLAYSRVLLT